jgi:fumarate hydratase class II
MSNRTPNDLKTIGLKATLPRLKILNLFETSAERHLTAEDVYKILLAEGMDSFREHCLVGLAPQRANIAKHVEQSLMLVTALAPHLGYERAAAIAHRAHHEGLSLRAAAIASGFLTAAQFDAWVRPADMTQPG